MLKGGGRQKTKNKDKRIFYIKMRCFKETIWQNKLIKPNHCNIQAKKRESLVNLYEVSQNQWLPGTYGKVVLVDDG